MATLNLTPEEFADIALLFLADKSVNPDKVVTGNENFEKFGEKAMPKIKGNLLKYYLDTDPQRRLEYKRIKGIFSGKKKDIQQIRIGPSDKIKDIKTKKKGIASKILKKLLKQEQLNHEELELLIEVGIFEED